MAKEILGDEFSNYINTHAEFDSDHGQKKLKDNDHDSGKDGGGGKLKVSYADMLVFYTAPQAQIQASFREIALNAIKKTPLQMEVETRDLVTILDAWFNKTFSEDVERKPA